MSFRYKTEHLEKVSLHPQKNEKSTKFVIILIKYFSIGDFKLTDREVTIVNEMEIFWIFSFSSIRFDFQLRK